LNDTNDRNIPTLNTFINNIIQISAGKEHSIVLNQTGSAFSFGENYVKEFF
jgi:alpha-tubulin suppressor-like RCC1 family protein